MFHYLVSASLCFYSLAIVSRYFLCSQIHFLPPHTWNYISLHLQWSSYLMLNIWHCHSCWNSPCKTGMVSFAQSGLSTNHTSFTSDLQWLDVILPETEPLVHHSENDLTAPLEFHCCSWWRLIQCLALSLQERLTRQVQHDVFSLKIEWK